MEIKLLKGYLGNHWLMRQDTSFTQVKDWAIAEGWVVFGSPVWSSFLTPRAIDCNRNQFFYFQILKKTGPNRCGPVHLGFLRLQDWS